ncbi:hypothetical protein VIGAN_10103200 [Vigna angularis var. angularis]|uniref:Uncharacterized protein n=1 Tax=Vigna angularis var. angularis TaxID=157739 RepID=A0A0S3T2X6_PHAAN|nr:hypothetical protein VIGAN_10103200 [Vigna angularis var. angularis]
MREQHTWRFISSSSLHFITHPAKEGAAGPPIFIHVSSRASPRSSSLRKGVTSSCLHVPTISTRIRPIPREPRVREV